MATNQVTVTANKFDPNTQTYSPAPVSTPATDSTLTNFNQSMKTPSMNASNISPATPIPIANPVVDTSSATSQLNQVTSDLGATVNSYQGKVDTARANAKNQLLDIANIQSLMGGKAADTQKIYGEQGVTDAYNQLVDLNAQATGLKNEASAIPIQIQNEFKGTGATEAGAGAIQTSRLRDNALKSLSLGQQAAIASAQYEKAKNYADMIVDSKYSQMEADIKAKQTNLAALNDYELTPAQESLKTAQTQKLQIQLQQIQDKKDTEKDINSVVIEAQKKGAPASVISAMQKSSDLAGALKSAGNWLADINTDVIKLENGSTIMVDKRTGAVIKNYGGASAPTFSGETPVIQRTVDTGTGGKVPVDAYTLKAGDDPYFIAQKYGTDMDTLKKLNPNVSDWTKLPIGAVLNIPSQNVGSGSILAATGLSIQAFNYLTQGTASMTRMNPQQRNQIMAEATKFLNTNGLDVSTFQSRYKTYNDVLSKNISRFNNTVIMEGELKGTLDNLSAVADEKSFGKLKVANVAKLFAGEQVNDPTTLQYAVHLNQLVSELAGYNAAVQGRTSTDVIDIEEAKRVIKNGLSSGSLKGFQDALHSSVEKMGGTLQTSVDRSNKQVWDLFGVGDKMPTPKQHVDPFQAVNAFNNASTGNQKIVATIKAQNPNASIQEIYDFMQSHGYIK